MNAPMLQLNQIYPVDAFPRIVREAIDEMHINVKAPVSLIATSALAAMSTTAQEMIMVKSPSGGQPKPVSLYLFVIAESGERKSTVDNRFCAPLHLRDSASENKHKEEMAAYRTRYRLWDCTQKELIRRITRATCDEQSVDKLSAQLADHQKAEPIKPQLHRLVMQNATERAVLEALDGNGKALAIIGDEGETVLESPLLAKNGALNKLWDGGPLTLARAGLSISARDTRLTVSIMAQSTPFRNYLRKRGNDARGTGLCSRILITWPQSTQGYRFENDVDPSWECLVKFHRVCNEMLDSTANDKAAGTLEQIVYELDDDAKSEWFNLVNYTESQIQPWGYLSDIHDFASKACEIMLRIAALFHHFSKQEGKISCDTLRRATSVVSYHINEFKRVFSPQYEIPQSYSDAQTLETYLRALCLHGGGTPVLRNDVLRKGPVRPKCRFDPALQSLQLTQKISVFKDNQRRSWISFNLQYFAAPQLGMV